MQIKVADKMQRGVYSARPEMSLRELITELVRREIRGCPVEDGQGRLVGVVSLSDAAVALGFPPEGNPDPTVGDVMAREVIGLEQTAPLQAAIDLFLKHRVHRLIITYQGRVVGILTPFDLIPTEEKKTVWL